MTPAARLVPMLSVADLDASVAFYRDLLAGEEVYRFPPDEPVFVTLRFGDAELGMVRRPASRCTDGRSDRRRATALVMLAAGSA